MASYRKNFIIVLLIVFYSILNHNNANCPLTDEDILECETHMKRYCGDDLTSLLNCAQEAIPKIFLEDTDDERPDLVILDEIRKFIRVKLSLDSDTSDDDEQQASNEGQASSTLDDEGQAPNEGQTSSTLDEEEQASILSRLSLDEGQAPNQYRPPNYIKRYFINKVSPYISIRGTPSTEEFCTVEVLVDRELLTYYLDMAEVFGVYIVKDSIVYSCTKKTKFLKDRPIHELLIKNDVEKYRGNKYAKMYLQSYATRISLANTEVEELISPSVYCQTFENN